MLRPSIDGDEKLLERIREELHPVLGDQIVPNVIEPDGLPKAKESFERVFALARLVTQAVRLAD